MGDSDVVYNDDYDEREDDRERAHYLGGGCWSHPETSGDFFFEDDRKNR